MTLQEIIDELDAMQRSGDPESAHGRADDLLCLALRGLGVGEVADAWESACMRVGFWYS